MEEGRLRQAEIVAYFKDDGAWSEMFILFDGKLLFAFHSRKWM